MVTIKKIGFLVTTLCSIVAFACNETLPLREDLSNLVTIKVRSLYYTTSHSILTGAIRTLITVTNNTDETLDDVAAMTGTVEITWTPRKEEEGLFNHTRTLKLTSNDIFFAKNFNRTTKRLTLDPGDSVVMYIDWNLKTNDSTYILDYCSAQFDNQCFVSLLGVGGRVPRRISLRQNFLVKADIKLFDRLAVLYIQNVRLSHCFMFQHGGELNKALGLPDCVDFIKFDPCSAVEH